jgi:hypothetical protein
MCSHTVYKVTPTNEMMSCNMVCPLLALKTHNYGKDRQLKLVTFFLSVSVK